MDKQLKALLIIAPENFRDEEYFQPRVIMLGSGIKTITTAKTKKEEATGVLGGKAKIDINECICCETCLDVCSFDALLMDK